jgi:hypothetical protein
MLKVLYIYCIYIYIYTYKHIVATYGKRMYINMSEVGEEWGLRRRWRAYDFRFEVSFIRWKSRDVSRNTPQNGVLPSLVSMVPSVTDSHTGTVSSLCSKIQYCQHKRARPEPYKSNPHHHGLLPLRFSCIILRDETPTQSIRVPHPRCLTGRTVLSYKIKRNGVMKVFDM